MNSPVENVNFSDTAASRGEPLHSSVSTVIPGEVASFSQACLSLFQVVHHGREDAHWQNSLYRAFQSVEKAAQADSLKGCVYVLNLLMGALSKVDASKLQPTQDQDQLLDWADHLCSFATSRIDESQAIKTLSLLEKLSWFPAVPETFSELISGRLRDDVARLAQSQALYLQATEIEQNHTALINNETEYVTELSCVEVDNVNETVFVAPKAITPPTVPSSEVGLHSPESAARDEFELLAEAFDQLAEDTAESLAQIDPAQIDQQAWIDLIESLEDRFVTASNAARFMGVESLEQSLEIWSCQFSALKLARTSLLDEYRGVLALLPSFWAEYFRAPSYETATTAMSLLNEPLWPSTIEAQRVETLTVRVGKIELIASRQVEQRSEDFDLEDLSLAIPSDADSTVVENLLVELPALSEQFTLLVSRITTGDRSSLEAAQRIAHTLKGSANTVGIRGVANLTHQLEDIFVIVARDSVDITGSLSEFLSEAADCLEEMSEAVAGVGSAPSNAAEVYAQAIQWTNRLVAAQSDEYIETEQSNFEEAEEVDGLGLSGLDVEPTLIIQPTFVAEPVAKQNIASVPVIAPVIAPYAAPIPAFVPFAQNIQAQKKIAEQVESARQEQAESQTDGQSIAEPEASVRVSVALIDKLLSLVGESSVLLAKVQNEVETINLTQRTVGDTASRLEELSHDLDRMVDSKSGLMMGNGRNREGFDELELDQYNELHTMARRFAEIGSDSRVLDEQLRQNVLQLTSVSAEMERMQSSVRDLTLQTRMVPVNSIAARLQRAVRQASRLTQKAVQLHVDGGETLIDNETLGRLVDPLMHLLRNAVDHGIESGAARVASGKSEIGQVFVSFIRDAGNLTIRCQDDGNGLDINSILAKAHQRGLVAPRVALTEAEVTELILLPGFSTRESTTQMSGRGVGLDVVAQLVRELKGSIEIQHAPGAGTSFLVTLPLNLSSMAVMVASSPDFAFALSLRGVEQIVSTEALYTEADQLSLVIDDVRYPAHYLEDLVGYPRDTRHSLERVAMLVRARRGELVAIIVPGLGQARNVIVKPLSALIRRKRGIDGAAALGDGTAAPICDLPELLVNDGELIVESRRSDEQYNKPLCLVVDDSVSVRRAMEAFVGDLGFDVVGARDGIEALTVLENRTPALIIADFEMPRMNGVELTRNIRGNARVGHVPIVMITSRSSEKHKTLALDAGVNHYMTKPYTEDDLAEQVYRFAGASMNRA